MAEDNTSYSNESISKKQLTEHLSSHRTPHNIYHQSNSYNHDASAITNLSIHSNENSSHNATNELLSERLPSHIQSPQCEIKERIPPITPFDNDISSTTQLMNNYKSIETPNTFIRCDTSNRSSFPDIDDLINVVIQTEYATNNQHSKPNITQNNTNSNDSNGHQNNSKNNRNNKDNSKHNRKNNDDEKKRDMNDNNDTIQKYKLNFKPQITEYTYSPNKIYKKCINGNVKHFKFSRTLTEIIIPNHVKENYIKNVYEYLCRLIAMIMIDGCDCNMGKIRIFNCGFHDKSGQVLYLIASKSNLKSYKYIMRDILYTKDKLFEELSKSKYYQRFSLPVLSKISINDMKEIYNGINDFIVCKNIINKTKWHKLQIFHTISNKQRITFAITKTEFVNILQLFINNSNSKELLPIVMFNNKYRIEYVQIVPLRENIYIGISYIYDKNSGIIVTGIHLNKNDIINQHQLLSTQHNCHCLDSFKSEIDYLHIGNPDDDKNRCKSLQKTQNKLKSQNKTLEEENEKLEAENRKFQDENDQLRKELDQIKQQAIHDVPTLQLQNVKMLLITTERDKLKRERDKLKTENDIFKKLNSIRNQQYTSQMNNLMVPRINLTSTPLPYTPSTFTPYTPAMVIHNSNSPNVIHMNTINTPQSFSAINTPRSVNNSEPNVNNKRQHFISDNEIYNGVINNTSQIIPITPINQSIISPCSIIHHSNSPNNININSLQRFPFPVIHKSVSVPIRLNNNQSNNLDLNMNDCNRTQNFISQSVVNNRQYNQQISGINIDEKDVSK